LHCIIVYMFYIFLTFYVHIQLLCDCKTQ